MRGTMADIQPATAEIRQGKKEDGKKQDHNIMSASATQGGHNKGQYDTHTHTHTCTHTQ